MLKTECCCHVKAPKVIITGSKGKIWVVLVEVVGDCEQRNNNVERYPQGCSVTERHDVKLDSIVNLAKIRDLGSICRRVI